MKCPALVVAAALLAGVAVGCGSTRQSAPDTTTTACQGPAQLRAYSLLRRDIAAIEAAGRVPVKNHLIGGPALNRATDRFLRDEASAPITNLKRNRFIDFAARYAVANCEQCFQALEAERPTPSMAREGTAATC